MAKATFGAGCFWHPQHVFDEVDGVTATWVGYMGGGKPKPTYLEVCNGTTGHAEVVHVEYDPEKVSYDRLLDILWETHDPTQQNRQGPDIGTQYRSVIFAHDDAQEAAAQASKEALGASGKYDRAIVTAIEPAQKFWEGEDYHQKYFERQNRPSILASLFGKK
ncbi:MAG: peptide-methionine (S)-S-oxide reductase [Alphaproteobacteria bacterium]|jgi:peptide-methionine (S)-S-oxide reductase